MAPESKNLPTLKAHIKIRFFPSGFLDVSSFYIQLSLLFCCHCHGLPCCLKDMFIDFRKRKGKNKREREPSIGCLLYALQPGTELATQVWALTRHQTRNLLVSRAMLQPTEPPGQAHSLFLYYILYKQVLVSSLYPLKK